jgi:hypothetical protein
VPEEQLGVLVMSGDISAFPTDNMHKCTGARVHQDCLALSGATVAGGALGGTSGVLDGVPVTLPDFLMIGAPKAGTTALPASPLPATDHQPLQPPPDSRRSS